MNKTSIIIGSLLIGLGLAALGLFINSGIKSFKMLDRSVLVKGLAEIEVPANRVIWPISYTEVGNDLQELYTTIEAKNQTIRNFLTSNGINSKEISVSAPKVNDRQANSYGNDKYVYRYSVSSVVTISSENVDKVRELMVEQTQLLKKGIAISADNWEYRTQFLFTKLNEVKPQMIEEATKNSRASAEKFAADSNSKLGKIKSAYQGQLSIEDRDENTPHIKSLRVVTTVEYLLED